MTAHAIFSASGSSRWLNCPGSIRMAAMSPKQQSTIYAMQGTAAHALGELCIKANLTTCQDYFQYYAEVDKDSGDTRFFRPEEPLSTPLPKNIFFIDQPFIDAVNVYLELVAELREEMPDAEEAIEERQDLTWVRPNMFGTVDYRRSEFLGKLVIADYKNGTHAVEVVENTQLMYYALGAVKRYDFSHEEIELIIIQPRAYHPDGPVRRWTVSMQRLLAFQKTIEEGYDRAVEDDAMLQAGSHCFFCPANGGICPEADAEVQRRAGADFAMAPIDDGGEAVELPMPRTPEELSKALAWVPMIDAWVKKIKSNAEALALNGTNVGGYKLVRKKTNRKWNDFTLEEDLVKEICDATDLLPSQLYKPSPLLGPAAIEKLSPKAKKFLKDSGLVIKPEGELTLVANKDPREAVVPLLQAAEDFKGVDLEETE